MSFELQPTLIGDLVELRPLREDDFDRLYTVAADPLIWEQHPARDRYQRDVFAEYFRGGLESGGAFLILDRRSGDAIGSSRYHGYDAARSVVEIGWTFIARRCWGGRYNSEIKALMLGHAFRFVDSVIFVVGSGNRRSQRAVEKLGAVRDGGRQDHLGEHYVYRLTKERRGVYSS